MLPSRIVPVVLLADDSPDVRKITKLLLELEGCFVIEASHGREAVDAALVSRPDLILLDIEMPVMNGLEVARHLRSNEAMNSTPMVAVTASNDKRLVAIEAGCDECITKPPLPDRIKRILSRYIHRYDLERPAA